MQDSGNLGIIGLSGPAGVGKTTVARLLKERLRNSNVFSLACPMKAFLSDLGAKKGDPDFRRMAQSLSILREVDPDVYVRALHRSIRHVHGFMTGWTWAIIDDIRFPNEIEYLRDRHPMVTVRLDRVFESGLTVEESRHPSEAWANDLNVDYTLDNNRSPEEAADDLFVLAGHIFGGEPLRIYVAGPLSNGDRIANAKLAITHAVGIQGLGHHVFVPHAQDMALAGTTPVSMGSANYSAGFNGSVDFLENWANALYRVPGDSWGADEEVRRARKRGLPILHNIRQVPGVGTKQITEPRAMGLSASLFRGNIKLPAQAA